MGQRGRQNISQLLTLAVYVQYVRGHLGTYKERGKGDWMDNKSCCQTEQRRRDERGVDIPRRAQPRQAE